MSVLPRKEVTTCSVVSVRFGVLTDDEVRRRHDRPPILSSLFSTRAHPLSHHQSCNPAQVRKLSVKRVTSPITFDNMGHPVPDGLYDPAMGPAGAGGPVPCATCGLPGAACPGHFGHVELPVPVYNPLLFG